MRRRVPNHLANLYSSAIELSNIPSGTGSKMSTSFGSNQYQKVRFPPVIIQRHDHHQQQQLQDQHSKAMSASLVTASGAVNLTSDQLSSSLDSRFNELKKVPIIVVVTSSFLSLFH